MKTSYLFLSNGFEEIEAVTIIDILRRAKIDLKIVNENYHLSIIISFTHNDNFISSTYINSLSEDAIISSIVKKYQGLITFDDKENLFIVNIWLKSNKSAVN